MSYPRTGAEIREAYLAFFESRGHTRLPSDSLIPSNDPTLLFSGAGMNQFKDEFLGRGRDLQRATTAQKCLRVPDLDNVGATPRHHTFFEMLGNFSFGDYFKAEVIPWEWQFFTEILGWDADRFVCTVYQDDDEAYNIWRDVIGIREDRIYRLGEKENFWPSAAPSKGPNGVCGPCSELYYDLEPGQPLPSNEGLEELPDRFLEVGNFVFTQFDRQDGGVLQPLPQKNIDVGLGLERIAAVAQGVANNFETDLFTPVLATLQKLSGCNYGQTEADDIRMRRIADHCRAVFFCIADGAAPGREGRGYVVRKILRRAVRDGIGLGIDQPFLASLLGPIQQTMADAYPQLRELESTILALCAAEEDRFRDVYRRGIERLEASIEDLKSTTGSTAETDSESGATDQGGGVYPGELAFELHDTYGFPVDITEVVAREHGLTLDMAGFEQAMESQRDRARSSTEISSDVFTESLASQLQTAGCKATDFQGYELDGVDAQVTALLSEGQLVSKLSAKQKGTVVLDCTPFYAEGGGQVGDQGIILNDQGAALFEVHSTTNEDGYSLHHGVALAELKTGVQVQPQIDPIARRATERHHTATHLLHAALKTVLGTHVNQAGSQVSPERLRFDYTHPESANREQIQQIEDLVLEQILLAAPVEIEHTTLDQAKQRGITALFGEKYGNEVRVVDVPGFSTELCGGTHVANIGAIGPFRIVSERALAAGVRRIEAVAGQVAADLARADQTLLHQLEQELKAPADRLAERIQALKAQLRQAKQAMSVALPDPKQLAEELAAGDPKFEWKHLAEVDAQGLRRMSDGMRKSTGLPEVVLLTGGSAKDVPFVLLCSPESGFDAGILAKEFGKFVGGGGGGRGPFAQGKGTKGDALDQAAKSLANSLAANA
jgi:alanyl-tRNA synthetase